MLYLWINFQPMCGTLISYLLGELNDYFYTKSSTSDMLNKNTLGVKKCEAKKKQHCEWISD